MTASPSKLELGTIIASQFRIERMLGQGGMGSVFLAEQLDMGRHVVIKVLNPELTTGNHVAVERFRREAQAVARLNHPNIVQIYVFGNTEEHQLYIAMEYVEGRDLGTDIEGGAMAQQRALRILDQACAALIEAHSAGIVHRDLKPENIMITNRHGNPDYVKVLDFGIAKLHDTGDQPSLTQAGTVFGTPRYMAPEQARGQNADARADIYALGIILHEMLTGHHPFNANTALDYLLQHVNEPVPLIRDAFPDIHLTPRVEAIVYRCLEKAPEDRYQSVAELQREVRLAMRDFSEAARGYPSSSSAAVAAAPAGRGARAMSPTSTAPGREREPARGGMPVWAWIAIGVGLAGGLVATVIATTGKPDVPTPIGLAAVPGAHEGTPGADPKPPEVKDPVVANTDPVDPVDPPEHVPVDAPDEPTETDKPVINNAGTPPNTAKNPTMPSKTRMKAIAKRIVKLTAENLAAEELWAALGDDDLRAINQFTEGGGDLDALIAELAREEAGGQLAVEAPDEPDEPDEPTTPPTTAGGPLKAGKPIDGFPLPAAAKSTFSTAQAELYEINAPPRDIVAFYKRQLAGRYAMEDIPNGIQIKDQDSPFSFVVLTPNGDTIMLSLTRNVMAPSTAKANTHNAADSIFGVKIPGKTTIIVRSETAVVLRSRQSMTEMCNYLRKNYGNLPKVVSVGDPEGSTPSCVVASSGGNYDWQAITAVNDPQSEGALMISISKAQ